MSKLSKVLSSLRPLAVVPVAVSGLVLAGPAAAAEPIEVVERVVVQEVTDTGAKGDSGGDILTFANEIYDAENNNKIGTDQGVCFRTVVGKAWECSWTVTLEKGQIAVQGPFYDSGDSVLAITGGTGEYADANGDMALSAVGTDGKAYRFIYKLN